MIATIVQTDELLQTILAAAVAGLGVTFLFSVGIWGAGQFAELSRSERPAAATAAAIVGALALLCVAAAVITGIIVMTHK
jgi:UDP:flavonoid glycosyltransferase YjiC (YdhE family)